MPTICFNARLEGAVELCELTWRAEIREARADAERKRRSAGSESGETVIEQRHNVGEHHILRDDWCWRISRPDVDIDRRPEVIACIDDVQVVERLDRLGETLYCCFLRRR